MIDIQCRFVDHREAVIGIDLLEFLRDWLVTHILEEDMAFRPYVEENEAAVEAAKSVPAMGTRPEEKAAFDWEALKVLIVDGNANRRAVTRTIMEMVHVAEVRESGSGAGALDQLLSFQPGAVVCGGRIGGMDGIEFARRMRDAASNPVHDLPLVMIADPGDGGYRQRAEEAGVDRCLEVPLRALTLLETVAEVVSARG